MIKEVTSKNNSRVKYAFSLKQSKNSKENKQFIAEGVKSLELAIKANLVKEVFTLKQLDLPYRISQYIVTKDIIEKLSSMISPEGVVFICDYPISTSSLGDKVVYLDGVNDPGNMGTIIRTALALGYTSLCYSKGSVSPYNEKCIAASKGAIFLLPLECKELKEFKGDYKIVVSALTDASINPEEMPSLDKYVLVLGNEAHGVSEETLSLADMVVKIPIKNIDSLNVAVAGSILMYELLKNSKK